jgi:hypothetical protein
MRITLLTAIALATLTASAHAQGPPAGSLVTDFPPVSTEITISDGAGTAVKSLACEWTEPQDDDRQCLRFQSDPQVAFAAIEEAGGVRADQHTVTEGADMTIAYSKRGDGTWLIRSKGTIDGAARHFGRVCTADGQHCARWDAEGARFARRDVKAAAAKLRKR